MDAIRILAMNAQVVIDEILRHSSEENTVVVGMLDQEDDAEATIITRNGNPETITKPISVVINALNDKPHSTNYHVEKYRLKCDESSAIMAVAVKQLPSKALKAIFTDAVLEDAFLEGTFVEASIV